MLSPRAWFLATAPIDLRCGADRLLVLVQSLAGGTIAEGPYRTPKQFKDEEKQRDQASTHRASLN